MGPELNSVGSIHYAGQDMIGNSELVGSNKQGFSTKLWLPSFLHGADCVRDAISVLAFCATCPCVGVDDLGDTSEIERVIVLCLYKLCIGDIANFEPYFEYCGY